METHTEGHPLVSVIIPMYNVAEVMERSLNSIARQTERNVEWLFVDDCSADDTCASLQAWIDRQEDKSHYRLLRHNVNQGVAVARNTGLDNASGEYVCYLDADDYMDTDALETMVREAETKHADIVGCEWMLTFARNERHIAQRDAETGEELFRQMCQGTMRWNLWLFMVRRSLYEDHAVRFIPKVNMGEDMMVMMKLALNAARVSIVHRPLYHYIQTNSNSLTKKYEASIPQIARNIEEVERYLHATGREALQPYIHMLQLSVKQPFLISSKKSDYHVWQTLFPEANAHIDENTTAPLRNRLLQKAALHGHYWFLRLYYYAIIKFVYGILYK